MDLNTAMNIALSTPSGSPPYYVACTICDLRGINPHNAADGAAGFVTANWHVVLAEALLAASLADMMRVRPDLTIAAALQDGGASVD